MPVITHASDKICKIDWIIREISFDSTAQFYNLKTFQERIFERTQVAIRISGKYWKDVVRPNWNKFMNVTPVGEQTIEMRMKYWIECYLENKPVQTREESAEDESPFIYKGHWHIPAEKFNNWCATTGKDQFGVVKSERDFSSIGATKVRYEVKSQYNGKRKSLRPWKIPVNIVPPPIMIVKGTSNGRHEISTNSKSNKGNSKLQNC